MTAANTVFGNVYICSWVARWDCGVHGLLCRASKLYAQSAAAKDVAASFIIRSIDVDGHIKYTRGPLNQLHRTDGPAFTHTSGYKAWRINGRRHRIGGPAIEWHNGSKEWWVNGRRHRIDGPAVEYGDDSPTEWWIDGRKLEIIDLGSKIMFRNSDR